MPQQLGSKVQLQDNTLLTQAPYHSLTQPSYQSQPKLQPQISVVQAPPILPTIDIIRDPPPFFSHNVTIRKTNVKAPELHKKNSQLQPPHLLGITGNSYPCGVVLMLM